MHANPVQPEPSLIAAAVKGDADAFSLLARDYAPRVYCLDRKSTR